MSSSSRRGEYGVLEWGGQHWELLHRARGPHGASSQPHFPPSPGFGGGCPQHRRVWGGLSPASPGFGGLFPPSRVLGAVPSIPPCPPWAGRCPGGGMPQPLTSRRSANGRGPWRGGAGAAPVGTGAAPGGPGAPRSPHAGHGEPPAGQPRRHVHGGDPPQGQEPRHGGEFGGSGGEKRLENPSSARSRGIPADPSGGAVSPERRWD